MKKICFMMWMMCTLMGTLIACSSEDNEGTNTPQQPVSGVTIPASAAINSEVIIRGAGFTGSGLELFLENHVKEQTKMEAVFTSAGVTFRIPLTLVEGTYNVVLKQNTHTWTLGSMVLTPAENPIISPVVPDYALLGKKVTLGGTGYEEGDQVILKAENKDDVVVETTLVETGLTFTLPVNLPEGNYKVFLQRAANAWELNSNAVLSVEKARRVKTILVDMGEMGKSTFSFVYNENNQLSSFADETGMCYEFVYSKDKISTTSPISEAPVTFTLQDGKVTQSTVTDASFLVELNNNWTYLQEQLVSVSAADMPDLNLELKYTEGNITHLAMEGMGLVLDFGYDKEAPSAVRHTVNPIIALQLMTLLSTKEDYVLANLLDIVGKTSSKIATSLKLPMGQDEATGEVIYETIPFTVTKAGDTVTVDAGEMGALLGMGKVVITYEVY